MSQVRRFFSLFLFPKACICLVIRQNWYSNPQRNILFLVIISLMMFIKDELFFLNVLQPWKMAVFCQQINRSVKNKISF